MKPIDTLRGWLWKLFDDRRNNSSVALRELRQWERRGLSTNEQQQWALVQAVLEHAQEHVPYYRHILPSSVRTLSVEEFRQIPLLSKEVLRRDFEDLQSDDLRSRDWYVNKSGGSTGEPVRVIQDREYHSYALATKRLFDEWTGYTAGQRKVLLWGSERDLLRGRELWKHRFGRWLRNELWLNSFRLNPERMRGYIAQMNSFRPVQVVAYVEAAYELGEFALREGLQLSAPQAVMTAAGTLHPPMRRAIRNAFRAPVFNRYGTREVGDIACECDAHGGLHVNVRTHFVEILREDGSEAVPGEIGEVVVTSLANRAMPLIRYRIGDMASWKGAECSCGRGWPLLEKVSGRKGDMLERSDGGIVVPETIIHMIGVVHGADGWIKRFQVVQERIDFVRVHIVAHADTDWHAKQDKNVLEEIRRTMVRVMGEDCEVEVMLVPEIPSSPSGKFRYTISRLR